MLFALYLLCLSYLITSILKTGIQAVLEWNAFERLYGAIANFYFSHKL